MSDGNDDQMQFHDDQMEYHNMKPTFGAWEICCQREFSAGQEYLYCRSKDHILAEDAEDEELAYLDNKLQKKSRTSQICKLFV
jgi:hypothetical protein